MSDVTATLEFGRLLWASVTPLLVIVLAFAALEAAYVVSWILYLRGRDLGRDRRMKEAGHE